MKQITKEELIEYFIEQLGNNNILGKYLSIEEIRNRLNARIKEIRYERKGNSLACYDNKNETINLNLDLIQETESETRVIIIHELLHVLSASKNEKDGIQTKKSGLLIAQIDHMGNENYCFGNGIDEGFTELLAEEIARERIFDLLNKSNDDEEKQKLTKELDFGQVAYEEEMDTTRILRILYGEEYLLGKYLSNLEDDKTIDEPCEYLFQEDSTVRNVLKEVIDSIDKINVAKIFHDYTAIMERKSAKNVWYDRIQDLIKIKLETTKNNEDLKSRMRKILKAFATSNSRKLNYKRNIDCVMHLNSPRIANALQEILIDENSEMQLGQMVDTYIRLTAPTEFWSQDKGTAYKQWEHSVENYCIKKGIIDESEVKKSGMLSHILQCYRKDLRDMQDEDFKDVLSHFGYTKVGAHYELSYTGDNESIWAATHGFLFDEDGKMAVTYGMFPSGDEWTCNMPKDTDYSEVDIEKIENIRAQVQNISKNSERKFTRAMVLGNDVILYYGGIDDRIVYSLNDDGKLTLSETGVSRRLTDDMSELDIKLQQETAGVSVTEMMQEADSMQMILGDKTPKTNENSREEYSK